MCVLCVAALALLGAGFGVGRYTRFLKPVVSAVFQEPLMEQAVRARLGKQEGETLTEEELLTVRALYIFGTEVSDTEDAFLEGMNGWTLPRGSLTSLEDVVMMPNLEVLYVNYQPLSDITPVRTLQKLRHINLRHTYVSDLSPLAGLPMLDSLQLFDTNVSDLSPLVACPQVSDLDIGFTPLRSIRDIPDLKGLTRLSLRGRTLADLDGIERFVRLEWLCLSGTEVQDLTPLLSLPNLKEVDINEPMYAAGDALGETPFTVKHE